MCLMNFDYVLIKHLWRVTKAVDEWLAEHNWTAAARAVRAFGHGRLRRRVGSQGEEALHKLRNWVWKSNPYSEAAPFTLGNGPHESFLQPVQSFLGWT